VTLTKRVDSNWYEGRNSSGRVGIFPSSYVQVLSEPSQQHRSQLLTCFSTFMRAEVGRSIGLD
jgi:hypothetical protein